MSTQHWDAVSFIVRSQYRQAVAAQLDTGPATPSQIRARAESSYSLSHISRAVVELRERGLVTLLVPEETKTGRLYALTDEGSRVWATAAANDLVVETDA